MGGGFYPHITETPNGFGVGSEVERGNFLARVVSFGGIPPHLHIALVEIIGGAPGGQYRGVDLYDLFLELETTYAGYYVPIRFMQDGTPPVPQWDRRLDTGYAPKPSEQTSSEHQAD